MLGSGGGKICLFCWKKVQTKIEQNRRFSGILNKTPLSFTESGCWADALSPAVLGRRFLHPMASRFAVGSQYTEYLYVFLHTLNVRRSIYAIF